MATANKYTIATTTVTAIIRPLYFWPASVNPLSRTNRLIISVFQPAQWPPRNTVQRWQKLFCASSITSPINGSPITTSSPQDRRQFVLPSPAYPPPLRTALPFLPLPLMFSHINQWFSLSPRPRLSIPASSLLPVFLQLFVVHAVSIFVLLCLSVIQPQSGFNSPGKRISGCGNRLGKY